MRNAGLTDYDSFQHEYFSPVQIPNCALWLDATDASTITQSGGFVSQWNDKSGNAQNVSQSAGAAQPSYASNLITFNGSSDYLQAASRIFTTPAPMTLGIKANIINPQTGSFAGRLLSERMSAGGLIFCTATNNVLRFFWVGSTELNVVSVNNVFDNVNTFSLMATYDGTNNASGVHLYVNGTEVSYATQQNGVTLTAADGVTTVGAEGSGGTGTFSNMNLSKALIYSSVLSSSALAQLNSYLMS